MKTRLLGGLNWFCISHGTLAALVMIVIGSESYGGIIVTGNAPYMTSGEVYTTDPAAVTNANRGLTTTRELFQSFKNPATIDVRNIVLSFRVTNASTGLQLKLYEDEDVNASNILTGTPPALGNLIHTISLPVGSYGTSSERIGVTLSGSDIFSLPQRDAGTTGYAISISQIDQSGSVVSGNLFYANNGTDNYVDGKVYQESGAAIECESRCGIIAVERARAGDDLSDAVGNVGRRRAGDQPPRSIRTKTKQKTGRELIES